LNDKIVKKKTLKIIMSIYVNILNLLFGQKH